MRVLHILFYHLEKLGRLNSGSGVRPTKIAEAFMQSGHDVHILAGSLSERKRKIRSYKTKMDKEGLKFDLVYFENSSWPTSLRVINLKEGFRSLDFSKAIVSIIPDIDIPLFSFSDLLFFWKCKRNGTITTMFYRDIYWKYPDAFQSISLTKRTLLYVFSSVDIIAYYFLFDKIFVPSREMAEILPMYDLVKERLDTLAPACQLISRKVEEKEPESKNISLLYVGGTGPLYDPSLTIRAVAAVPDVSFNLCTRAAEWAVYKENCNFPVLPSNLTVHHLTGNELTDLYIASDVAVHTAPPFGYITFAMPVKIFEYFSNQLPVIAYSGTAYANLILIEDLGWVIPYNVEALVSLLTQLAKTPELVLQKKEKVLRYAKENGWDTRVRKVISTCESVN